jgi:quercetin dioxygenase-like cupin family protein
MEKPEIQTGNAQTDNSLGWFVGGSLPENLGLRHTYDVELKWSTHKAGEERPNWVTKEARTTVAILISGKYEVMFREQSTVLAKQGDFVMWGKGCDHKGRALEDSVILTVRWPSIPRPA